MVHRVTASDNEWQRMTKSGVTSNNEWQRVTASGTTSDNEWQRVTTSDNGDNEWYNKWQRVTASNTTSDHEWQKMPMTDSEWQQCYNEWKRHSTLQRMDDCLAFNEKDRYTTASRDVLEWLNKWTFLKVSQEGN